MCRKLTAGSFLASIRDWFYKTSFWPKT
jgi:hypothetical protein